MIPSTPSAGLARRALALALGAAALAACGGGGEAATPATTVPPASIELAAGPVTVQATGAPGALADPDRDAVLATLAAYIEAATLDPLQGKPVGDLAPLFTAAAAPSVLGPERASLVDEGVPEASGKISASAPPVPLSALTDVSSAPVLVGATLDLSVRAPSVAGPVTIRRLGELVLAKEGEQWKIASYRLSVERGGAGLDATTSTTAGT